MVDILSLPTVPELIRTAEDMYRLGWNERNSGNISCLLSQEESQHIADRSVIRTFPLGLAADGIAGRYMLITSTGSYFKNMRRCPEDCLGIVRISDDGQNAELVLGFENGGRPTSELPAHVMSHLSRLEVDKGHSVVLHCHPANIMAMTYVHELDDAKFSHTLWRMCTEGIIVFPDGVSVLPWMPCGTKGIGRATAEKMREFRIVIWAHHGIYGVGSTLDEAFGLVETVEKAAQIFMLTSHLPHINTISDANLAELAEVFDVAYRKDFIKS